MPSPARGEGEISHTCFAASSQRKRNALSRVRPPPSRWSGRPMTSWSALAARRGGIPLLDPGHVWLAGAGPGDPGLLTLDALAGLSQADVVVHDALVDRRVLALAGAQARLEYAGKRGGKPSPIQSDISKRLV